MTKRNSKVLSGNNLGMLGNSATIPIVGEVFYDDRLTQIIKEYEGDHDSMQQALHLYAKELLETGSIDKAWQVLLSEID